jgi:hypothetical protein
MILSKVFINGIYQGNTSGTSWSINKIFTGAAPDGARYFLPMPAFTTFTWRVDTYDTDTTQTTTGDSWTYKTTNNDNSRPVNPDGRWGWDPISGGYKWLSTDVTAGGGRYRSQLVVIGHRTIYYGEI